MSEFNSELETAGGAKAPPVTFDEMDDADRAKGYHAAAAAAPPEFTDDDGEDEVVFDNQSLADPSLAFNALKNQPPPTDDTYPRFAMSGLLPIALYRQNGNNSYADFNKKNKITGANDINYNWYPAFTIMPLLGGTFNIPFENKMTESEEPPEAGEFDIDSFLKKKPDGYSAVTRNPKQCADIYLRENRPSGGYVFDALIGYHLTDDDRGIGAAKRLIETILPYTDRDIFPIKERAKGGVVFRGPFLDEMLAFVNANGRARLREAGYDLSEIGVPMRMLIEIRRLLQIGVTSATKIVDDTEAEIQDPNGLKRTYDPQNLEIDDAPVSTDLYCLAHIDRVQLDEKNLHASKNIGSSLADPMTKAVETMTEMVSKMGQQQLPQQAATGFSKEEVAAMLDAQRLQFEASFDAKFKAATAAASSTVDETNTTGPGDSAVKNSKKK